MSPFVRTLPLLGALAGIAALFALQPAHAVDSGAAAAAALLSAPPAGTSVGTGSVAVETGKSGLPLPRFVSLKASKVNVRVGPGEDYPIAWTFMRPALPVEVIQEFDTWRRVRDSDGSVGWVLHNLLTSKRTAVVAPWSAGEPRALRSVPSEAGTVTAYLEAGLQAEVEKCQGDWCQLSGRGFAGWIAQAELWGVYPGEEIP
jgi:SH3-like domain-containing protein